jgi:hypothetical protein
VNGTNLLLMVHPAAVELVRKLFGQSAESALRVAWLAWVSVSSGETSGASDADRAPIGWARKGWV